jgi:hypothetical protein
LIVVIQNCSSSFRQVGTQLPPTKVGGLRLRPPPTKSGQTVADCTKTIFTERMMKLIVFKTLNAPAKAGGFNQLIENKNNGVSNVCYPLEISLIFQ